MTRYGQLVYESSGSSTLAEASPLELPDEITLQSLWFAGQFGKRFTSTDGKAVEIIQFGHWNRSAGPDFLEVAVEIDGKVIKGPLEFDTHTLDWEGHGHAENPEFDSTILHVSISAPSSDYFIRTSKGQQVPSVILPPELVRSALVQPRFSVANAHPGRCSTPLQNMPTETVLDLQRSAALHRASEKARRLQRSINVHGVNETLWQALARALGYRNNQLPFTLISQRLNIRSLLQDVENIEPLLFGAAGFLNANLVDRAEGDSQDYLRNLWERWWQLRSEYELAHSRALTWKMAGVRPVNHPHRRLGALTALALSWRSYSHSFREMPYRDLEKKLVSLQHPFWSHHYTLTSKTSEKPIALIGSARAKDFIMNVIAPLRLERGEIEWPAYAKLSASTQNEKLDKATVRLFGKRADTKLFLKKAWQQQALLQIYDDFCLNDSSDCADCHFPEQLAQWTQP